MNGALSRPSDVDIYIRSNMQDSKGRVQIGIKKSVENSILGGGRVKNGKIFHTFLRWVKYV